MILFALMACNGPLSPDDIRTQLDNPTATLSADTIPDVTDDWFRSQAGYTGEKDAWGLVNLASGDPVNSFIDLPGNLGPSPYATLASAALGDVVCAVDFVAQLSTFDSCESGSTCKASFTFNSCLLDDEGAKGKIRFTITEENLSEYDRGSLKIEFINFRTTDASGIWDQLDGSIEIETTEYSDGLRSELIYGIDFKERTFDPEQRSLFQNGQLTEERIRAAFRVSAFDDGTQENLEVEMLAWLNENGNNEESVVVRFDLGVFDDSLVGASLELIDAAGSWTCTWESAEQQVGEVTTWISRGTCTDPDGETVTFDGKVTSD